MHSLRGLQRREWLAWAGAGISGLAITPGTAHAQSSSTWERITASARGQRVVFHTTGRNEPLNAYVQWVIGAMQEQYEVQVQHVRTEPETSMERIRGEVAQELPFGSVDLLALTGVHLTHMLRQGLLFGPLGDSLPNPPLVDADRMPVVLREGGESIKGMAAPWGMSQLTFWLDGQRFSKTPADVSELLGMARSVPGRMSYPMPSDSMGALFLQQLLWSLSPDRGPLEKAPTNASRTAAWARVWTYLDALHPLLWRKGLEMPQSNEHMRQMMYQDELSLGLSIEASEAAREVAAKRLKPDTRVFQFREGTLAQAHFVAIPVNARSKAGALCLVNFLLSPQAQGRKADPALWGDTSVLNADALPDTQRRWFRQATKEGALNPSGPTVSLPHPGWMEGLQAAWNGRYVRR